MPMGKRASDPTPAQRRTRLKRDLKEFWGCPWLTKELEKLAAEDGCTLTKTKSPAPVP